MLLKFHTVALGQNCQQLQRRRTVLTVLVQVELRRPSADVGDGAHDGQAVGQLLLVLMVVLLQQRLPHLLSELWPQRRIQLLVVQDHVWGVTDGQILGTD